jgi:hypothetical protein
MSETDLLQERTMSPRAYERAIAALGLSQAAAGRWLGVSERTSRRYVAGEATVPPAQVLLLRTFVDLQLTPRVPPWRREAN